MKRTKFLALLTTSVLALSMSTAVFAEDVKSVSTLEAGALGTTVDAKGEAKLPTINVEMPSTHTFTINPYKISAKTQIDSTTAKIVNKSDVAIDVELKSATVTFGGASKNKVVLLKKEEVDKSTAKGVYIELKYAVADSTKDPSKDEVTYDPTKNIPILAKTPTTSLGTLKAADAAKKTNEALFLQYDGQTVVNPATGWDTADIATISSVYTFNVSTK